MIRTFKRYVALDPERKPCGPCTTDEDTCWKGLRIGYERTFHKPATDQAIRDLGYSVVLATVTIEDGVEPEDEEPHSLGID